MTQWVAILFRVMGPTAVFSCILAPFCLFIFDKNDPCPPLAPNQVDIESEVTSEEGCRGCIDPAGWTFRNAASQPVPHLLAPYRSQAEYSGALAGVNRAIDESPHGCCVCCVRCDCCVRTERIRRIDDALAPFRQKGLEAQYMVGDGGDGYGNGRRKSRIRVTVPSTMPRAPAGGRVPPGRAEMQRPDMTPQAPGWFWQESDGTWIPYSQRDSDELDRMKATGRPNAIVAGVYKVDFRTMTQTNTRTRFQRPVWCSDGNAQAGAVEAAGVVVAVH